LVSQGTFLLIGNIMKRIILLIVTCIFILAACTPKAAATEVSTSPAAATEQPTATFTPMPSSTPEPLPSTTPIPSATAAASKKPIKFTLISASAQWQTSSMIVLETNQTVGKYYATANSEGAHASKYVCAFSQDNKNKLTCTGGYMPLQQKVYVNLYDVSTDQLVYSNKITFAGIVPTPTGMTCEVEPQWNGFIPAHQKDKNCFALTCYQNGSFFYGDNNTCEQPWPYEWNFVHPLSTPNH
jgi:hypothetical protein